MVDDSKAKVDFKKQVEALKKFKGRGTELVSLYITPDYPVHDVMARLRDEYGQASNIKSKSTQKNVQAALERIMHFLKGVNKPPENGIAVFAGNVSQSEGKTDYQIYSVVPPMPLNTQFYRCESKFILEPLEELMDQSGAYGLVVMDGKEATVAVLRGTKTDVIKRLNSTAHQKVHKGGQCVHENSVVLTTRGAIKASEVRAGDALLSFDLKNFKSVFSKCAKVMKRNAAEEYVVETNYPSKYLALTGEHVVFVLTSMGVMEKRVSELEKGDVLLAVWNAPQLLENAAVNNNLDLAGQVQGYFLGDGTIDGNRLVFYDADEQLITHYSRLASSLFDCNYSMRKRVRGYSLKSRKPRGCFESKIYSKKAVDRLIEEMPELSRKRMPPLVSIGYAKGFLKGLFDAEASVSIKSGRIAFAMADEDVVLRVSSWLTLFGISTSVFRKKAVFSQQYGLEICDLDSLTNFALKIGFNSEAKSRNLAAMIAGRKSSGKNKRVPIHGKIAREAARRFKMPVYKYAPNSAMFLNGKRFMSSNQFKSDLLTRFSARCEELQGTPQHDEAMRFLNYLHGVAESDACISVVKSVKKQEPTSEFYYDFEVPSTRCFIANGLAVHNSAARYDRLHIEAVEYYYKRVGQAMDAFVGLKNFKGVIIGGPGPAKDDFAKMKTYNYQLHVLGVVDTGYTDEYGIREVIEKSSEIIAEQETVLENKLLDEFMREISKNGLAVYGFEEIKQVLETGQASHLLVTEGMDLVRVEYDCPDCKKHLVHFVEPPVGAVNCDCGKAFNIKEEDAVGLLISLAESKNIPITFVSKDTAEGAQFYATFRGIGAFLRYK
ncbi:MAG: LAGLIDADG family homing endonuclease [Candidatus Micrarchaeota archaeon]